MLLINSNKPCRLLIASGCCTEHAEGFERSVLGCSSRIASQVGSLVGFSGVANQASRTIIINERFFTFNLCVKVIKTAMVPLELIWESLQLNILPGSKGFQD